MNKDYHPVEEYAVIGDCKTTALLHGEDATDFYCCPRFDFPSVFTKILDCGKGGGFNVRPKLIEFTTNQHYLLKTNLLLTRYRSTTVTLDITDYVYEFEKGSEAIDTGNENHSRTCQFFI